MAHVTVLTFIAGQRIPNALSSTIWCDLEETWTWVCLSLLYFSRVGYKHTHPGYFSLFSQATFHRGHLVCCQKAAPCLLPVSGSLRVVSVMLKQGQIGLLFCRSEWPRGQDGGWAARLSPATAVVQGCVSGWGWGDFVVRILQVLILHLKHTKGQNLEQRGPTYREGSVLQPRV